MTKQKSIPTPIPMPSTLSPNQQSALAEVLRYLQEYQEDFGEMNGSLMGPNLWFQEYTKSDTWAALSNDRKDTAFSIHNSLRLITEVFEDASHTLFPEGESSPLIFASE